MAIWYIITAQKRFRVCSEENGHDVYSIRMTYTQADGFVQAFGGQVVCDHNKKLLP